MLRAGRREGRRRARSTRTRRRAAGSTCCARPASRSSSPTRSRRARRTRRGGRGCAKRRPFVTLKLARDARRARRRARLALDLGRGVAPPCARAARAGRRRRRRDGDGARRRSAADGARRRRERQPRRLAFGRGPLPEARAAQRRRSRKSSRALADEGVQSLLLEGGPTLATSFLRARLVDKLLLFVAPRIAGAGLAFAPELDEPLALTRMTAERLGDDVLLSRVRSRAELKRPRRLAGELVEPRRVLAGKPDDQHRHLGDLGRDELQQAGASPRPRPGGRRTRSISGWSGRGRCAASRSRSSKNPKRPVTVVSRTARGSPAPRPVLAERRRRPSRGPSGSDTSPLSRRLAASSARCVLPAPAGRRRRRGGRARRARPRARPRAPPARPRGRRAARRPARPARVRLGAAGARSASSSGSCARIARSSSCRARPGSMPSSPGASGAQSRYASSASACRPAPVESEHQLPAQVLAQRVPRDE